MTIEDELRADNIELRAENAELRLQLLLQNKLLGSWRELVEAYQITEEDQASQEPLV